MNTGERVGAWLGAAVVVFGIGVGWNSLNNRIDRVDEKIGAIQKTLGSTACTSILTRQIEAIEKGRAEARKALEGLSDQYGCVPRRGDGLPIDLGIDYNMATDASATSLGNQLNAVDVLLNEDN